MTLAAKLTTLRSVFIALASIQLATAASGTLVPLYFFEIGASQEAASLAASAYSAGFMVGCFIVARSISGIGHIRAFAGAAAIATSAAVLFAVVELAWMLVLLRFMVGLATASLYAIGDAWVSERAEGQARGRVLSVYAIVVGLVAVGSQFMVVFLPEDVSEIFSFVALLYCLAIVVIANTRSDPPDKGTKISLRVRGVFADSPVSVVGAVIIGIVGTNILSVAPFGAAQIGIHPTDIAIIIGSIYLGRVLLQYPVGLLSDAMDRRVVIMFGSAVAAVVLLAMALLSDTNYQPERFEFLSVPFLVLFILMVGLGGSLLTLYSLFVAHAIDKTAPVFVSSTTVAVLFIWTLGSVVGPLITSGVTSVLGDHSMNWMNVILMLSLTVFTALRISRSDPAARAEKTTHADIVPTSTEIVPEQKRA